MKSFLMLGQSNMAGRGNFGEVPEIVNNNCYMLRMGKWQKMSEPINLDRGVFCKWFSGVGLAASFADEYAKHFKEDIGLIPCADGGTHLSEWQPGEVLFENAVYQGKLAQRSSEIVGILWHQGESDSGSLERVNSYKDKFDTLMKALFKELNLPAETPIIIGELGDFVGTYENGFLKHYKKINKILLEISNALPRSAYISAEGLTCKEDGIHFTSASYREFGKRYFEGYLKLVNEDNL